MRRISTILALLFAAGLIVAVYVGVLYFGENIKPIAPKVEIRVLPGAYLRDVQNMLVEKGVLSHPRLFRWVAVITGKDRKVQAGRYVFLRGMSISRMLHKLSHAEFEVTRLTIPEGFMLREIAGAVERQVEIDSAQFYRTVCDPGLIKQLGINAPSLEGYLFPDTYLLSWPISSHDLAKLMVERFREVYDKEIADYAYAAGLSTNEIVTLASIIQAEAQSEPEMNRISAVYQNRMRRGLRLEADPTVAYALGGVRRGLHYSDLKVESPYNTYRNKGLPPGPICSPGLRSLLAAVQPLGDCEDLYFVAAGDGKHFFSKTHEEHMKAKKYAKALRDTIANQKSEKAAQKLPASEPAKEPQKEQGQS
ncbi:MAG: endolytic transglycosylase MltG [Candidatus Krumholzibacteria bacterium]|nr:endolytic transglycosylase MltG [Candidatus Krumholzibacteria bacterium]